jgi:hypothetical protein
MRSGALVVLACLGGCSLSSEGLGTDDPITSDSGAGAVDSGVVLDDTTMADDTATIDSGAPPVIDSAKPDTAPPPDTAKPDTAPPPDTGPPCDETSCGANPTGAKRIGLGDRLIACPPGFVTTDIMEVRDGDACTCTCATTVPPSCPGTGSIPTWYSDGTATCATAAASVTSVGNTLCSSTGGPGMLHKYFRATPIPPMAGTCATNVFADKSAASRPRRMCEAAACAAPICTGTPWIECIEAATCGGAFPTQHLVGTDVGVTCPTCGCDTTGTCSATMTFYANGDCTGGTSSVLVNDACGTVPAGGPPTVNSFRYAAVLSSSACSPAYMKSKGAPVITGQRSLCCR